MFDNQGMTTLRRSEAHFQKTVTPGISDDERFTRLSDSSTVSDILRWQDRAE